MNIDKRWLVLLAVAASAGGAAVALNLRRGHHRTAREKDHKSDVKAWENEGGNLAPTPAATAAP